MKLKIKIKLSEGQEMPEIIRKGDFVDLRYYGETVTLKEGSFSILSLGVAMQLPAGFEAVVVSRSSTFKNFSVFNPGGFGLIDNSYCGNNDDWKYPAYALKETVLTTGSRICQFRIQLSQKATFWQKLRWLFSNGIELVKVDKLENADRKGLGSTGKI